MKAFYRNELKHLQMKETQSRSWNSSKLRQTGSVNKELSWTSNTSEHSKHFYLFTLVHNLSYLFISRIEVPITKVTSEYLLLRKKQLCKAQLQEIR